MKGLHKSYGFVEFEHKESVMYAISLMGGVCLSGRPLKVRLGVKVDPPVPTTPSFKSAPEDSAAVVKVTLPSVTNGCVDQVEAKLKQQFGNRLSSPLPLVLADEVSENMEHTEDNLPSLCSENDVAIEIHKSAAAMTSVTLSNVVSPNQEPSPSSPFLPISGVLPPELPPLMGFSPQPVGTSPLNLPRPLFPCLPQVPPTPLFQPPQSTFTSDQNKSPTPLFLDSTVPRPLDYSRDESTSVTLKSRIFEEFASRVITAVSSFSSSNGTRVIGGNTEIDRGSTIGDNNLDRMSSSLEQAGSDWDHMSSSLEQAGSDLDQTSSDWDHMSYGRDHRASVLSPRKTDTDERVQSLVPHHYAEDTQWFSGSNFPENGSFSNNLEDHHGPENDSNCSSEGLPNFCHNGGPGYERCNVKKSMSYDNHH